MLKCCGYLLHIKRTANKKQNKIKNITKLRRSFRWTIFNEENFNETYPKPLFSESIRFSHTIQREIHDDCVCVCMCVFALLLLMAFVHYQVRLN